MVVKTKENLKEFGNHSGGRALFNKHDGDNNLVGLAQGWPGVCGNDGSNGYPLLPKLAVVGWVGRQPGTSQRRLLGSNWMLRPRDSLSEEFSSMVAWVDGQGHRRKLVIIMSFSLQDITTALLRKGQGQLHETL